MNDQYEDKYIGSHMYHLENVIEKELFNTLKTHCKNDRGWSSRYQWTVN